MVTLNKRFDISDDDYIEKLERDAEYWRMALADEVRLGRAERFAAACVGFGCGALAIAVVVVGVWFATT